MNIQQLVCIGILILAIVVFVLIKRKIHRDARRDAERYTRAILGGLKP